MPNTDTEYLMAHQYSSASNLGARMALHERFSTAGQSWHHWVFDQLELPAEADVLELGSGSGALWAENCGRVPAGWKLTLTDLSPGMLEAARTKLEGCGLRAKYSLADAQQIPFGDSSFDAVIANHMLYHVPDRDPALAEIVRVLRPGAVLYAATNGLAHMQQLRELTRTVMPELGDGTRADAGFTLENGGPQLEAQFGQVELRHHEDSLEVTEPEPLMAYVMSRTDVHTLLSSLPPAEAEQRVESLRSLLVRTIHERGSVHISKSSGLFVARK